jgi:hypothetical protein
MVGQISELPGEECFDHRGELRSFNRSGRRRRIGRPGISGNDLSFVATIISGGLGFRVLLPSVFCLLPSDF